MSGSRLRRTYQHKLPAKDETIGDGLQGQLGTGLALEVAPEHVAVARLPDFDTRALSLHSQS